VLPFFDRFLKVITLIKIKTITGNIIQNEAQTKQRQEIMKYSYFECLSLKFQTG
jgi:hypothetical protein